MNNISWFLYAVDVLHAISVLAVLVTVFAGLGTAATFMAKVCSSYDERRYQSRDDYSEALKNATYWKDLWGKYSKIGFVLFCVALPLAMLIPETKTMYLIIGSEVGETVVMSETGQRVQDAINKKLDEYLGET